MLYVIVKRDDHEPEAIAPSAETRNRRGSLSSIKASADLIIDKSESYIPHCALASFEKRNLFFYLPSNWPREKN